MIVRKVNDAQTLNRPENILWNITQIVVSKVNQLQLSGILESIKVQLMDPIVTEVQPLQMGHVAKDITGGVLKRNNVNRSHILK